MPGTFRAVAVTGIGVVGPTGVGKEAFWEAIVHGPSPIARITLFDTDSYASQIAGEVRDVSYRDLVPAHRLRTTTRSSQFALAATELALRDAHLDLQRYEADQRGVALGTSLGGWLEAQQQCGILLDKGANRVNPFIANGSANHAAAVEIAVATNSQGTHATFSTGCCASMHAIGHAAELVARGELECCLAGGTEAPITPLVLAAMGRTSELSCANEDPAHASKPFDVRHDGFVLSEGSVVLVIESLARARDRGAPIYAEICGHASAIDATDPFRVDQSGIAAARGIHACLARSGIAPSDLNYVCANGNSSPHFDRKETNVLKRALGEFAAALPISSIKGVLGHPFGASSAFQVAASCLAISRHLIPPTHNLTEPDPACDLDFVPMAGRPAELRHVLVCSYGFGGMNSFLTLRAS